jgi:hypothetical protein
MTLLDFLNSVDNTLDELVSIAAHNRGTEEEKWLKEVLKNHLGAKTYIVGAALSRLILPDETVEMTQLISCAQVTKWTLAAEKILASTIYSQTILDGTYGNEEMVKCKAMPPAAGMRIEKLGHNLRSHSLYVRVNETPWSISANNIRSVLLAAALEEVNSLVGNNNIFKRSLFLIKAWCRYESSRFSFFGKGKKTFC